MNKARSTTCNMISKTVNIKKLQSADIKSAMELVRAERWNQTEKDWQRFIKNPLNVCKAAEIEGKIVGTATSFNYSNKVAWIGMVLVGKEYRGKGISKLLLNSVLNELQNIKSIKLDATLAGQSVYKKLGFINEYQIFSMVNVSIEGLPSTNFSICPELVNEEDIPAIIKFDKRVFGANRTQLIKSLVSEFPEKSWVIKSDSQITGFALGRKGNRYHRIGPVSAQTLAEAKILISQQLKNLSGQSVVIDIPENKEELAIWLHSMGFEKQRHFTRMFKHYNPFPGELSLQYSISGPEFG